MLQKLARRSLSSVAAGDAVSYTSLENGVRIASAPFAGAVASVGVTVNVGSRNETEATSGLCAVVQAAKTLEAAKAVAKVGGTVRGYSSRESTTFVATCLKEYAGEASAVLAGCVTSPPSAEAFGVAKAAALAKASTPPVTAADVVDEVHGCAYLETQMGAPVGGTKASVESLTLTDAETLMAGFGGLSAVAVGVDGASTLGAALSSKTAPVSPAPAVDPAVFTGSDKKISYDSYPLAQIALAYEFPTLDTEHAAACKLLPFLLAPTASSAAKTSLAEPYNSHVKLTRDLAEQEAGTAVPFYIPYSDTALFGLSLAAPDIRVEDSVWYATNNLVRLCYEVSESELARAKQTFKTHLLHTLATPDGLAKAYLDDIALLGRAVPAAELVARVDALAVTDIKKLAYDFIHDNDHALAAVGPLHELPDYNWVRTASYNYHY